MEPITIKMDKFKPRSYQMEFCRVMEENIYKKILVIAPRRSGKDLAAFNMIAREAVRRVGVYMYCLPTFKQAKLVVWDSITNSGDSFLSYIPKQIIKSSNSVELKIKLINGSIIQLIGSDSYDTSLVGTNPRMVVFSEYALADPRAYHYVRPILNANGGKLVILSTPRGKNHLYDIYQIAKNNPEEWWVSYQTLADTKHIDWAEIQKEIDSGEISKDLAEQEYNCSFDIGVSGAIFSDYIQVMRLNGNLGSYPWDPTLPVNTSWDIGRDMTAIIFWQISGNSIHIIDSYQESQKELPYFARFLDTKPYKYGKHFAPHDGANTEWGSGLGRMTLAREVGIEFETRDGKSYIPRLSYESSIEYGRVCFARLCINENTCKELVKSIENYRYKKDEITQVNSRVPLHDKFSHFATAFCYMATAASMLKGKETTALELEERYRSIIADDELPPMFREHQPPNQFGFRF